jgi:hypothetical protein
MYSNMAQHALNSAFALFEIFIPRTNPTPWLHLVTIVLILALYLCVAYITWATQHFYVYTFLDNQTNPPAVVAGAIVGILALSCIIFVIVHFVLLLRVRITEERWHMIGKGRGRKIEAEDIELREEVPK